CRPSQLSTLEMHAGSGLVAPPLPPSPGSLPPCPPSPSSPPSPPSPPSPSERSSKASSSKMNLLVSTEQLAPSKAPSTRLPVKKRRRREVKKCMGRSSLLKMPHSTQTGKA